jgi:hypothetical protein
MSLRAALQAVLQCKQSGYIEVLHMKKGPRTSYRLTVPPRLFLEEPIDFYYSEHCDFILDTFVRDTFN